MTYKTHFIGGLCAGMVGSILLTNAIDPLVLGVSAVSSLVPDIDIEGSKVSNHAKTVSKAVTHFTHHRGFFHTPILYIILYFLIKMIPVMPILMNSLALGFLLGTMSHLVLDTFNSKGIMWLYPLSKKHYHIASIRTRTAGETLFTIVMIVVSLIFVLRDTVYAQEMVEHIKEVEILKNIDIENIINIDNINNFIFENVNRVKNMI